MRVVASFAFLLFAFVPGFTQEHSTFDHPGCKVYFTVYWADARIPGGYAPRMHKEQKNWYEKTLVKKYPSVCMNSEKAAYAIIWSSEFEPFTLTLPVSRQSTTHISGDVNATATTTSDGYGTFESKTNNVYMFVYPLNRRRNLYHSKRQGDLCNAAGELVDLSSRPQARAGGRD